MILSVVGPTVLAGAALLSSGASLKSLSSWVAPDAGQLRFAGQRVAVVVLTAHPESRHGSEDYLAFELKKRGVEAVQAYSLVPESQTKNREAAKAAFDKAGMVGVVVMRVVGSDQELTATPSTWVGVSYSSFWGGYYDYGMAYTYVPVPGYIMNETVLTIETLVFDLRRDKLVFAGRTRATNPQRVDTLVKELVNKAVKDMQKQGLIGAAR